MANLSTTHGMPLPAYSVARGSEFRFLARESLTRYQPPPITDYATADRFCFTISLRRP